ARSAESVPSRSCRDTVSKQDGTSAYANQPFASDHPRSSSAQARSRGPVHHRHRRTSPMHSTLNRRQFLSVSALTLTAAGLAGCSTTTTKTTSFVRPTSAAVTAAEAKRRSTGTVVQRALTAEPVTLDLGGKTAKTWAYRGASAAQPLRGNVGDTLQVAFTNDLPDPTSVHWHGLALRNDMDGVPSLTQDAGKPATAWAAPGASAAQPLRGDVGDTLKVASTSDLPAPTSVHWHGLALRTDMDGVPSLTQDAVKPGGSFDYEFTLPASGTFWFH